MANALYNHGKKNFLQGDINIETDTIKTRLVRIVSAGASVYTFSQTHEFLSSINSAITTNDGGSSTTTDQTIGSITASAGGTPGVVDGNDVTHPTVTSTGTGAAVGDQFAVVVYKDTGSAATSPLIAFYDTGTGFPITPDGGAETIQWAAATPFMFAL
jgi:hypothetical protein